jgi:hypothetical protein
VVARRWLALALGAVAALGVAGSPAIAAPTLIGSDLSAAADGSVVPGSANTVAQGVAPASGAAAGGWTAPSDGVVVGWTVKSSGTASQVRFRIV